VSGQNYLESRLLLWKKSVDALNVNSLEKLAQLAQAVTKADSACIAFLTGEILTRRIQIGDLFASNQYKNSPEQVIIQTKSAQAVFSPVWEDQPSKKFRYYCGAPILLNVNQVVGVISTLSLADRRPTASEISELNALGEVVTSLIEAEIRMAISAETLESAHSQIQKLTSYARGLQEDHLTLQEKEQELGEQNVILQDLAETDGLTGLFNQRAFFQTMTERIRTRSVTSLILLDVDNFKAFNDEFGHVEGDRVLAGIGSIIKSIAGTKHICYRYGGEELAIIVRDESETFALDLAEKIRSAIESYPFGPRIITICAGIASLDSGISSTEEIVKRSDQALYAGKRSGKNRVLAWNG